ncbi:hypothetical protein BBJ28_00015908 [Nothophytophthora sp. Chile5]|nr:hypothetical protein BBJ28_00015908 [Nothophytophthora sp. Chile5]
MTSELDDGAFVPPADRALDASNRGYRLLQKMGWRSGSGLGKSEQEYDEMAQLATSERRKLDVEVAETPEETVAREAKGVREDQRKTEVRDMQAAFYCEACRKQYKTVTEMENHLSSYDHHHTKRLRDLQQQHKSKGRGEQSAKRRKELQKEELLLQKRIAQAAQAEAAPSHPLPVSETETSGRTTAGLGSSNRPEEQKKVEMGSTKVGFSFGGGLRMNKKKPTKKAPMGIASVFGTQNDGDVSSQL